MISIPPFSVTRPALVIATTLTAGNLLPAAEVTAQRGRVRYLERTVLASDRIGVLDADLPREGDRVKSGQTVVRMQDDVHVAQMATARARAENDAPVAAAKREYDVSVKELTAARAANARVPNAIPGIEVERLALARDRNEYRIQQANNEQSVFDLEHERLVVEHGTFTIDAPHEGVVVRVHHRRGEAVRQGDPVLEIVNPARMKVEGFVTVAEALTIGRGDKVRVRPLLPGVVVPADATSTGEIVFVDLAIQPVTKLVRVWAEVDNPRGLLLDGLDAELTIEVNPDRRVVGNARTGNENDADG